MKTWIILEFLSLIGALVCVVIGNGVDAAALMGGAVYCNLNARGEP